MTGSRIVLPEGRLITPTTPVQSADFLRHLYQGTPEQQGAIEFRSFNAQGQFESRQWAQWPGEVTLPRFQTHRNIFYGLALRREAGNTPGVGGARNCLPTVLLNADLDLKGASLFSAPGEAVLAMTDDELRGDASELARLALERSRACGLEPLAVVYTGHGVQMLWSLPAPVPHDDTVRYNEALGTVFKDGFGHDAKTKDVSRVLRLPGTWNVKNPERPLPVEVWGLADARIDPAALEPLMPQRRTTVTLSLMTRQGAEGSQEQPTVIEAFNARHTIEEMLERYGYRREFDDRYTRPGDGASGNDVHLLHNSRGVLCSYHHSGNDPIVGTPGDPHLRDPFALYRDHEHGGNEKAAVRAAAKLLGLSRTETTHRASKQRINDESADNGEGDKRPPVPTRVVDYVLAQGGEPWHDRYRTAYISVIVGEHVEHYQLDSQAAEDHLRTLYYRQERRSLSSQALEEASSLLGTMARVDGPEHTTGLRSVHHEGFTYLDLGDTTWRVVRVGAGGWEIIPSGECPVRFARPPGMLPLPTPQPGGSLRELGALLNISLVGLILCIAWLVAALSGLRPYPLLALGGEEGAGKSTVASVLRRLIDPHQADRRRTPRNEKDLFVGTQNAHVLCYDNLSTIATWLSDALCVVSTGGADASRKLYTNSQEQVLEAARPLIVNGIPDLLARPDLAERALTVTLQRIAPHDRVTEASFWARYNEARPRVLGALLTALAGALERLPSTELPQAPRLADFARLIVAAEPDLPWEPGEFLRAYSAMQTDAASILLDDEPVAEAIRDLLDKIPSGEWEGTLKALLQSLNEDRVPDPRIKGWPGTPKALGVSLRRLAAALSKVGYHVLPTGRRSKAGLTYRLHRTAAVTYSAPLDGLDDFDAVMNGAFGTEPQNVAAARTAVNGAAAGDVHAEIEVHIDLNRPRPEEAVLDDVNVTDEHGERLSGDQQDEDDAPASGEL